jgi:hypothetical protein
MTNLLPESQPAPSDTSPGPAEPDQDRSPAEPKKATGPRVSRTRVPRDGLGPMNITERYYFTWGCGQQYENGYHVIDAESWHAARALMFERFGLGWCGQYSEAEWIRDGVSQAERYGLHEVHYPPTIDASSAMKGHDDDPVH